MQIVILAVGKMKKGYLQQGIIEYSQRISHYIPFLIQEVKESQGSNLKGGQLKRDMEEEGERLLRGIHGSSYLIPLHEGGKYLTSKGLATSLTNLKNSGQEKVIFFIGGPFGLSLKVIQRGDLVLSLSPMTFPHELARLILVEQIYRACKIMAKEPYHH